MVAMGEKREKKKMKKKGKGINLTHIATHYRQG